MAEGLLRSKLQAAESPLQVISAGTHGTGKRPASGHAIRVLAEKGVDLGGHRSREIDLELVRQADLIVAMSRTHEAAVAALDQSARSKTFLAGEVARLGSRVGSKDASETMQTWVESLHAARGGHMTSGRVTDEVADPYGYPEEVYRRALDRLDGICSTLARLLVADKEPLAKP